MTRLFARILTQITVVIICMLPSLILANQDAIESVEVLDEQSMLFDDIPSVFGASKYEQKTTEAPASVTIITAGEIQKYGYQTLADILQSVRGFVIGNDRNYTLSNLRGFGPPGDYNNRILFLLDGRRINDPLYDAVGLDHEFIADIDLIKQVEVIRGPGSSLYGTNALFGVVNVITKSGRDFKGSETALSYGEFDSKKGRITYGNKFNNGVEALISATSFESDGDDDLFFPEFNDPTTNNGVAENADNEENESFFAKLSYKDFTFQAAYNDRERRIPTASYGTEFNDPRSRTEDATIQLKLNHAHNFSNLVSLSSELFYGEYDYDGDFVYDYGLADLVVNQDYSKAKWWGGELQLTVNSFDKHTLVLGGEFTDAFQLDQGNGDLDVYLDEDHDAFDWGIYLQDEYQLSNNVVISAGLRHDDNNEYGGETNPRIGFIYNPKLGTTLKLLYGTAYRAPNAYEQYYNDDFATTKPALDLDSEKIQTIEFVLEQSITDEVRGVFNLFHYDADDLITLVLDPADGLLIFDNADEVEANGVEFELEGKWLNGWSGRLSYSLQETIDRATHSQFVNAPKQLAKANIIIPFFSERLFSGVEVQYVDDRKTVQDTSASSYTIANLTLSAPNVWRGLDFSASVYNLFDE
ncbi:MAG: TonB-dependent receptor, partial [Gammaproteobacteria bacterium]|nr:TonB-dependent receptor [Gammaproteobacteria bacterium]